MPARRPRLHRFALCALVAVQFVACSPKDWRDPLVSEAEAELRADVRDPKATFTHLQFTGDKATGQTCGYVKPTRGLPVRFIDYIDHTAGPFVEGGEGRIPMSEDRFEQAWQNDCVAEGYKG